ncbi:uncharacterized protein N0V89_010179 [Didymosphaeria variabile]|uniref:Uncharacterized protein n=1 Tax=Didymosphaeria variabile TaxID=1932322 RepID=A0A9W8XGJ0_9PLEO|nr:uncharacterized protein N0V89_010179 [Didymosphaeria variabile]KAJ4348801.1 hypothetical protein N0V89_010179 [Didymosphaeria variabile]
MIGTQILLVLGILNTSTAAMVHQRRVVGAVLHVHNALACIDPTFKGVPIIEAIASILKADLFPDASAPKAGFARAFQDYDAHRPRRADGHWEQRKGGIYHGPSVVHQHPHPFDEQDQTDFMQMLQSSSPNSTNLRPIADWSVVDMMEQMRLTASREFSGDEPLARVNFIAVFLFCAEVLRKFGNCEDMPFTLERASNAVGRIVQALEQLDVKGQAAVGAGPAAGLKATLQSFNRRRPDEIFWDEL